MKYRELNRLAGSLEIRVVSEQEAGIGLMNENSQASWISTWSETKQLVASRRSILASHSTPPTPAQPMLSPAMARKIVWAGVHRKP